jgi:hypothetical protein
MWNGLAAAGQNDYHTKTLSYHNYLYGMRMNRYSFISRLTSITFASLLALVAVSCVFSPKEGSTDGPPVDNSWAEPTTPDKVLSNLRTSFNLLDIEYYERCLDVNFYYTSPSAEDSLDISWSRSEERAVMENMMDQVKEIVFTASENTRYEEWGSNVPGIPTGAKIDLQGEHPDDIWVIIDMYVTIDVFTQDSGDFRAEQNMQFKMVEDRETELYSIIQWYDENPLTQ